MDTGLSGQTATPKKQHYIPRKELGYSNLYSSKRFASVINGENDSGQPRPQTTSKSSGHGGYVIIEKGEDKKNKHFEVNKMLYAPVEHIKSNGYSKPREVKTTKSKPKLDAKLAKESNRYDGMSAYMDSYNQLLLDYNVQMGLYLSPGKVKLMEYVRHEIMKSADDMEHYLTYGFGDQELLNLTSTLIIPAAITRPPAFNMNKFYPLNGTLTGFATTVPYSYLPTFSYGSFMKAYNIILKRPISNDVHRRLFEEVHKQIVTVQHQTRMSTMYRQLTAYLMAADYHFGTTKNVFRSLVHKLLVKSDGHMKIGESRNRNGVNFVFNDDASPSSLPIVFYIIMQAITACVTCDVSVNDIIDLVNVQLSYFDGSYQDNKLKYKSLSTMWVEKCLLKFKFLPAVKWTCYGDYKGEYLKLLRHGRLDSLIDKTFNEEYAKYPALIQKLISRVMSNVRTIDDFRRALVFMRYVSNEGMNLDAIDDLVLEDAIQPKQVIKPVSAPEVTNTAIFQDGIDLPATIRSTDIYCRRVAAQYTEYLEVVRERMKSINLEEKWFSSLTTSSSGTKLDEELLRQLGLKLLGSHSRYVVQAATSSHFRDLATFLSNREQIARLGKRTQILRRTRRILMVTNETLLTGLPIYTVGSMITEYHKDAALGKQKGNMHDMSNLLYWSGMQNVYLSSMDVKGMDASMQNPVKELIFEFVFNVLVACADEMFGPFTRTNAHMVNVEGDRIEIDISASYTATMQYYANFRNTAKYYSKLFGTDRNVRDSPFGSGLWFTSINHTNILNNLIRANQRIRIHERRRDVLAYTTSLGDDLLNVYMGPDEDIMDHVQYDTESLNGLGFETKAELSQVTGEFLQQRAFNGVYIGYPDRTPFFSREKRTERLSLKASADELISLANDMTHRVFNLDGLKLLVFLILLYCVARVTLKLSHSSLTILKSMLSTFNLDYFFTDSKKDSMTTLVTIYAPISWIFHENGCGLPPFATERYDGTYTHNWSLLSARGPPLRRYYYDLVGVNDLNCQFERNFSFLNSYNVFETYLFCSLDKYGLNRIDKYARADPSVVTILASNIENINDPERSVRSRRAYQRLISTENGKKAFTLPSTIVYGLKPYERIKQSIEQAGRPDAGIEKVVTTGLMDIIREVYRFRRIEQYHGVIFNDRDGLYRHAIVPERVLDHHEPLYDGIIPLSGILKPGTGEYNFVRWMGLMNSEISDMRMQLSAVKGEYARFSYDDPLFTAGFKIFMSDAGQLEDFFTAVSCNATTRIALVNGFRLFAKYGRVMYPSIISPRQLFFLNDDPLCAERFVSSMNTRDNGDVLAFNAVVVYHYLLSNPKIISSDVRYQIYLR